MTFNFLAQKLIQTDIKQYHKSDLNSVGIYCHVNDEYIKNIKAMIVGPKDTPYENGFYFFDINFENDYPFTPPKVKFLTYESGVRFNPNLYTNGKVCLSILGTWSGPGWTTCLNLNTVLLSIQSLLNENPLQNEPGFDTDTSIKAIDYAKIIAYFNIKTATIGMIKNPPPGFESFKPIMEQHFLKNIDFYRNYLNKNRDLNLKPLTSRIYSMSTICQIESLESDLENIYTSLSDITIPITHNNDNEIQPDKENKIEKPIKTKKSPTEPAKQYEIGYEKISDNDGLKYKVVQVSGPKRTMKRWVKVK